ncbi:MAG: DNRLRE domain-containing protein [Candidatus Jordarchaeales archaeon]
MNKTRIVLGFLAIVLAYSITPYTFTRVKGDTMPLHTINVSPSADASVWEGEPNRNDNLDFLYVQSLSNKNGRSFINFNLSRIPPGSVIYSATLKLFMFDAPPSSRTMVCDRVTQFSWSEAGITWNNQPDATEYVTSIATGTIDNVWLSLTVTASVQKFVSKDSAGYAPNYGWRLKDKAESASSTILWRMWSKEYSDSSKRPYLEVKYYPPHLELSLESTTLEAGKWVKMTVFRRTNEGEPVTRGTLKVNLSSTSTSANNKFSLTQGGPAITQLTIPDGSDRKDFYYYDDKVGTWNIRVVTYDYLYFVFSGGYFIAVINYGDDTKSLSVTPGPLDRFIFDTIVSPQIVAVPFSITITAYDAYGNVKTDYTGTNSLSDTTGTIIPTVTGAFVNGKWTGMVTISKTSNNIKIATSGAGKTGESNLFNVKAGPPAKLVITPSSFTMAAGVTYSYLNITLRDANNFETTHTSPIAVSLSTTSSDGEFREFGTATRITGVIIPAGSSSVKVDYYDVKGGTWTLTASVSGLTSGTATVTVIPDTVPPVTTIRIGSPKYLSGTTTYVSGLTVFELSATDDASGVKETKYRFDGGSWEIYILGFTLSILSDGPHTIGYYSIDRAGNNEVEKTVPIILDNTPPTISGALPTGSIVIGSTSVKFTVRVEDSGSGVKEVRLTVDGVSQGVMMSGSDYSKTISLSEGSHTWSIEAVDNLDNAASWSGTFMLTVDTAPPTVSGLSAPPNPVFGESTTITCQVSDVLSGVKEANLYYSINGGSSWTKVAMSLQGGVYTGSIPSQMFFTEVQYYVEAVDNVGNETRTPVAKYTVGIPIWLYAAILALIVVIVAVMLLRRRKPPYVQPLPPTPPPPPP